MRGRAATVALPALVVAALTAVVAIAATGSTPGGNDATRPPSQTLFDLGFTLGLVAVALGGLLLLYGLMQRKAIASEVASGKYRRTGIVSYLLFFFVFTGYSYWRLENWEPPATAQDEQEFAFPGELQLPSLPPEAETSYTPSVSWIPLLVVGALLLVGMLAYLLSERRARGGRGSDGLSLAERLADVLDETLDDLRAETDPRRAVIAAYARLERVLAANGVPRHAAETSQEYLERVLRSLGLAGEAIGRLTELFTRAKFSQHVVDSEMKQDAIGALEAVRDELRRARAESLSARDRAPAGVGAGAPA